MDELSEWLLAGPPWVEYRARLDLFGQPEDDPQVGEARRAMVAHPQVTGLLADLAGWPWAAITSHKQAGQALHKLTFLADLGLKATDASLEQVVGRILAQQSPEGAFQVLMNIPVAYGGSGQAQWAWALCDAPLSLYALVKFGLGEERSVQIACEHLAGLVRENGWPCAVSPALGKFRGPGRKDDPCPYATLAVLKAFSALPPGSRWHDSQASRTGAEALLTLWAERRERHPYLFFMGTDFCKLKAPLVWYDILHVAEVLTQFRWLRADPRLVAITAMIAAKAGGQGRFTPEAIWTAWKEWDFGQKRAPSRWLTLLVHRLLRRMGA